MQTLLRLSEVTRRTGLSDSTIERLIARGEFPAPIRVADRSKRWPSNEVSDWIEQQIAKSRQGTA